MELAALNCPNCGGGLGAPQDGQYVCSYCGHRSVPQEPVLDQARQDELVTAAVARHEAARVERARAAAEQQSRREREEIAAERASDGLGLRLAGGLLLVLGVALLGWGLYWEVGPVDALTRERGAPIVLVSSAFSLAVGGILFRAGVGALHSLKREDRLRAQGLHGRGTVTSYGETKYLGGLLTVEGRYDLVLRVEVVGRPPYTVKMRDTVRGGVTMMAGLEVPVFVDPNAPKSVMVDWVTARAMT